MPLVGMNLHRRHPLRYLEAGFSRAAIETNEPQNLHQQASLKSRSRLCVGLFRKIKTPNYECKHPGDEEHNAQGDNPVWPHGATPLNSFDNKK